MDSTTKFSTEDLTRWKKEINPAIIISKRMHLTRENSEWVGTCPPCFHDKILGHPDKTPSFKIWKLDDGTWGYKCFGCQAHGNVYQFVQAFDGVPFGEAVEKVLAEAGNTQLAAIAADSKKPCTITQASVDLLQKQFAANPAVQQWTAAFGITLEVADRLRLGAHDRIPFPKGYSNAVATPHYAHDGKTIIGLKYRALPDKDFTQETGSSIDGLYAAALVDAGADYILVLEGDKDVAIAKSHGFNAVAILATSSKLSPADIDLLKRYPKIFLLGDQDQGGIEAMDKLAKRLPERQVIRVRLQVKDIGELYEQHHANFAVQLWCVLRDACVTRKHFGWDDLLTEDEILQKQGVKLEYAIDQLVPLRRITLLYGQEKSGKSLMALSWGKCVANGLKVFGKYATKKMPVLYLDAEHSVVGEYLSWMKPLGKEPIRFRILESGVPALDDPALMAICAEMHPLLIIDSLHKFNPEGGNTWSSSVMEQIMAKLLRLNALGATIILIHHAVRADVERYANSFAIGAAVDFMLAVVSSQKESNGTHRITLVGKASRGAQPPTVKLIAFPFLKTTGQMVLDGDAPQTPKELVYDFIEQHDGANTRAIIQGVKINSDQIIAILKASVESDELKVGIGANRAKHYHRNQVFSDGQEHTIQDSMFSDARTLGEHTPDVEVR